MAIFAIGNIEGNFNRFKKILEKGNFDMQNDILYLLGNFVGFEKGYEAVYCVDYIIENTKKGCFFPIMGTSEELLTDVLVKYDNKDLEEVADKYYFLFLKYDRPDIAKEHLDFFKNLPKYIETPKYVFSHAGLMLGANESLRNALENHKLSNVKKDSFNRMHILSHFDVRTTYSEKACFYNYINNTLLINRDINDKKNGGMMLVNLDKNIVYREI